MGTSAKRTDGAFGGHAVLAFVVLLLVAVGVDRLMDGTGVVAEPAVVAVGVTHPLDAWLGGQATLDGDVGLAESVVPPGVSITSGSGEVRFELIDPATASGEEILRAAVGAYEVAVGELRSGLDERLDLLAELGAFLGRRTEAIDGQITNMDDRLASRTERALASLRADRAAAMAAVLDHQERVEMLMTMPESALAPVWESTPVGSRLARIDEVLGGIFWFAMGEEA